jgi:hypothetical protein
MQKGRIKYGSAKRERMIPIINDVALLQYYSIEGYDELLTMCRKVTLHITMTHTVYIITHQLHQQQY